MRTVLDYMGEMFAENNVDLSVDQMKGLISMNLREITEPKKYVANLKYLARCIHINTIDDVIATERVKKEFIPLVSQAMSKITWKGKYFDYARNVLREKVINLRRYCRGLDCIKVF